MHNVFRKLSLRASRGDTGRPSRPEFTQFPHFTACKSLLAFSYSPAFSTRQAKYNVDVWHQMVTFFIRNTGNQKLGT